MNEINNNKKEIEHYWSKAVKILERELPSPMFTSWIKPIKPYKINHNKNQFILIAPEDATKVTLEHRYLSSIIQIVQAVTEKEYNIKIILPDDIDKKTGAILENDKKSDLSFTTNLMNKYLFENFVKGKSNEMAFAASFAVAEAPGETTYNPLFLYGGVGLGKTHLMHSIGNHIIHHDPESKVLYTSAENMMNEFISSLRERKNQEFRNKYRKIDVLLIDDIQFLSEKEGTQEEFFHTFNALYNDNKQIVISSDKPPVELKTLEERLRSRFGSGLIVDITLPDFETRTAILEKKAEIENIKIPPDVVRYIAKNVSSNIRELEGALIKVTAYSKLTNADITINLAERALKDMTNNIESQEITIGFIQNIVANNYGVSVEDMKSKRRTKNITFSRHVAMYLCRMIMDIALLKIGNEFGGRDHTTVIHACNKINDEIETNPELKDTLFALERQIRGE